MKIILILYREGQHKFIFNAINPVNMKQKFYLFYILQVQTKIAST